jgi:branched-chain amino acid transport system substrate-binding protein
MSKITKRILLIVAVFAIVFAIGACGNDDSGDNGDINLGVLLPISGPQATFGFDMERAIILAAEEINAAGGVLGGRMFNVLPVADDGCDPMMAAMAGAAIAASDAHFVLGGYCSGATIAALQELYDNDLIMVIAASNSTVITEMGLSTAFMLNSPGTHQIDKLLEIIQHLDVTNVAVVHQGDDFTQNLSQISDRVLPPAGINIVTTQVMEIGVPDASAIVTAIRHAEAELVFWAGYYADGGNMLRQLRAGGFDGYIVTADGATSVELIVASGPAGEGVLALSPPAAQFSPGGEAFIAAYEARWGQSPGAFDPLAYTSLRLLAHAIETAGTTDVEAVRDALQNVDFSGLTGRVLFTPERELRYSNFIVLEIRDGAFVYRDDI